MTRAQIMIAILATAAILSIRCNPESGGIGSTDTDTDSDSDADTDDWLEVPSCMLACETAADCAYDGSTLFDADNYLCDQGGHCVYQGCNTDEECVDSYGDEYGCSDDPGNDTIPSCVRTCQEVGDCPEEYGLGAYDYDNYECTDVGYCKYLGCNDSDECFETHGSNDYSCLDDQFLPVRTCQRTCQEAADCDSAAGDAFDEDNYLCQDTRCIYTGCNSTGECEDSTGLGDGWECVEP